MSCNSTIHPKQAGCTKQSLFEFAANLSPQGTDLAGDVMSVEVKTTDMLMNPGERAKLLDGPFCCL